jgi:hypothetical protein
VTGQAWDGVIKRQCVAPGPNNPPIRERKVFKNPRAFGFAAADHKVDGRLITVDALAIPAARASLEKSLLHIL